MRLAFIHGINNEDNSAESIRENWWAAIEEGWRKLGLTPKSCPPIDVGYYANVLAEAVAGRHPGAIAQGGNEASRSAALDFLRAYQEAARISDEELSLALEMSGRRPDVVEQGRLLEYMVDVAAAIETVLPRHGKFLADRFLVQAGHYIEDAGLASQIGLIVRKAVFDNRDGPVVLVSHSLGTVVSYKLLAEARQETRQVPLFITLGSPLGIGMMKRILPVRTTVPAPPIGTWVNGFRQDDFVSLGRALVKGALGFDGVVNISEGLVEEDDKHSISAYLKSPPICARIHDALS